MRTTSASYDDNGNTAASTDGRGTTTTFTYDALDNVTVLLWLLGPAPDEELHGPRLTMMMVLPRLPKTWAISVAM